MPLTPEQLEELRATPLNGPNRLNAARELAGLTQVQLAEGVGMTQGYLSKLGTRESGRPSYDTVAKLAEFFGCEMEDLFPRGSEAMAS